MSFSIFKQENHLYSILDLMKICKVSRNKLLNLIKIFDIPFVQHKRNKFYDENSLSKIQELLNREDYFQLMLETGSLKRCGYKSPNQDPRKKAKLKESLQKRYGVSNVFQLESVKQKTIETKKTRVYKKRKKPCFCTKDGFIIYTDVWRNLDLTRKRLDKLLKYYSINTIKIGYFFYLTLQDYEFLSKQILTLPEDLKVKLFPVKGLTKKEIREKLQIGWDKTFFDILTELNIKHKMYYTEDDFIKIKDYYHNSKTYKKISLRKDHETIGSIARLLDVSRNKIIHYMQFIPIEEGECINDRFYSESYVNKLKNLYSQYPEIKQNRVYVKGLNICFDSRPEAIFYIYLRDHNMPVEFHSNILYYIDSKGKKRRYEVDFKVSGTLVEIKGRNHFDNEGNPIFQGKSWKEKYDCMKANNVTIIKSNQFEARGCLKFMTDYFNQNYSFEKSLPVEITGKEDEIFKGRT